MPVVSLNRSLSSHSVSLDSLLQDCSTVSSLLNQVTWKLHSQVSPQASRRGLTS